MAQMFELEATQIEADFTSLLHYSYSKDKGLTREISLDVGPSEFYLQVDQDGHASLNSGTKSVKFKISKEEAKAKILLGGFGSDFASVRFYASPCKGGRVRITGAAGFGKDNFIRFGVNRSVVVYPDEIFKRTVEQMEFYRRGVQIKNRTAEELKKVGEY
ncbi:MAG: hypothetical protein LBG61_00065 [Burkholderiales bacterium]|jgi:hypothetical protein|nr:hypothetical protein [Burkholderiales bacterium]